MAAALFFPSSRYLDAQWWHRLANVLFWAWVLFISLSALNMLVLQPFSSCVGVKIQSEMLLDTPSDLDCPRCQDSCRLC